MVDGIGGAADDCAGGQVMAVDSRAASQDVAGQKAAYGRGDAQRLVDAGLQIRTGAQLGAGSDVLDVLEGRSHFVG